MEHELEPLWAFMGRFICPKNPASGCRGVLATEFCPDQMIEILAMNEEHALGIGKLMSETGKVSCFHGKRVFVGIR